MRYALLLTLAALPMAASAQTRDLVNASSVIDLPAVVHAMSVHVVDPVAKLDEDVQLSLPDGTNGDDSTPSLTEVVPVSVPKADVAAVDQKAVAVKMIVDSKGQPQSLEVVKSTTPDVDKMAMEAVKQYRFAPATSGNKKVETAMLVTVTFGTK